MDIDLTPRTDISGSVDYELFESEFWVTQCKFDETKIDTDVKKGKKTRRYEHHVTEAEKRRIDKKRDSNLRSSRKCGAKREAKKEIALRAIKHVLKFLPRLGTPNNPTIASMIRMCNTALAENKNDKI